MIVDQAKVQVGKWENQLTMILDEIKNSRIENGNSQEKQNAITKITEARHWLAEEFSMLEAMQPTFQTPSRRLIPTEQPDTV